jgi:hypothetical protein
MMVGDNLEINACDLLTSEKVDAVWSIDSDNVIIENGKLKAIRSGCAQVSYAFNNQVQTQLIWIMDCNQELISNPGDFEIDYFESDGKAQFRLGTNAPSVSRLDYIWETSDSSICAISVYSTLTITGMKDGNVIIAAISKSDPTKRGFIQLTIENGKIVEMTKR